MRAEAIHRETFKKGSKTYFNSSLFFPAAVRDDVYILYAFVRTADNFVDDVPQRPEELAGFKKLWVRAWGGESVDDTIVSAFAELARRKGFAPEWVSGFFHSMELDLTKKVYRTIEETLDYIYGSAEVIGLFMARIMDLDSEADHAAKMLGRAMQYINFLRDVEEDARLGRTYLPLGETPFEKLDEVAVKRSPGEFTSFMRRQIDLYRTWESEGEAGYAFLPRRYRIPIKTAADMYRWTADQIEKDPFVVYRRKVKPSRPRIMMRIVGNALAREREVGERHRA
jgi:phytoene synthase